MREPRQDAVAGQVFAARSPDRPGQADAATEPRGRYRGVAGTAAADHDDTTRGIAQPGGAVLGLAQDRRIAAVEERMRHGSSGLAHDVPLFAAVQNNVISGGFNMVDLFRFEENNPIG